MKSKKYLLTILSFLSLVSCQSAGAEKPIDSYRDVLTFKNDSFNILHLTDIHWNYSTIINESKQYMQAIFDDAKAENGSIDLVVITGDLFLDANKYLVETLFSFLSSWEVPIAITYGNHDKEGEWNTSYMNKMVSESENFIAKINDGDNVYGDTNYFIDINSNNDTLWRLYIIDSNSLARKNGIKYQYDNIHENQVDWMKRIANNDASQVPSLGFMHIPPKELGNALEEANGNYIMGEINEKICPAALDSSFFEEAKKIGMKGMFYGHDHSNDAIVEYQNVIMGYGVKANTELYSYTDNNNLTHTGYSLYSLKKDRSWSIKQIYINYSDMTSVVRSNVWESK